MANQPTKKPTNKVIASSLAAAVTTLVAYIIKATTDVEIDPGAQGAITVILTFLAGYIVPDSGGE